MNTQGEVQNTPLTLMDPNTLTVERQMLNFVRRHSLFPVLLLLSQPREHDTYAYTYTLLTDQQQASITKEKNDSFYYRTLREAN